MDESLVEQIIGSKGPLFGEKIKNIKSINGGCIHDAWKLTLISGETFFAKTNSLASYKILEFEFFGLKALGAYADHSLLIIPKPFAITKLETASILLMPWINMQVNDEKLLGKGLAMMHKFSASNNQGLFGWEKDGFIGSGNQPKGFRKSWGECFVDLRLKPQLKSAKKWGLDINHYSKILSQISHFLNKHNPCPSIVHGDLWKGNVGIHSDGKGVIFDPAVWWADREVDLAMTHLFGGFTKEFYEGYDEIWPLSKSYQLRIEIYNLYHLLNHANIFGGSYKDQCILSLKKLQRI